MSVYFIAEIAEITDPELYAEYRRQVPAVIAQYGGTFVVRGGAPRPVFGDWQPASLVVIAFADAEAAQACFASPEYQRIAPLREGSTVSRAVVVDRLPAE